MSEFDWTLTNTPGHFFSRIARAMTRVGDQRLKAVGFASAQLPVLTALKDGAKLSQGDLARRAKVEQPTMAQLLARMERDGLVKCEADPSDGRGSLISLTKSAMTRIPQGRAILHKGNEEMLQGFSKTEAETLLSLLMRVLDNVDAMERDL